MHETTLRMVATCAGFLFFASTIMPLLANAANDNTVPQASSLPGTDIYLAEVENGALINVRNISHRPGYDNQPHITSKGIYYTSERILDGVRQTDIAFYDFQSQATQWFTASLESEYSPIAFADGVTSVVVEQDGDQVLKLLNQTKAPAILLDAKAAIGYHSWGEEQELLTFMLGENGQANYLELRKSPRAGGKVIAKSVGRSLSFNPTLRRFVFTLQGDAEQWLASYNAITGEVEKHLKLPLGVQDVTWRDDNTLIYALNNIIYERPMAIHRLPRMWLDARSLCQTQITRLSYLKADKKLAFVCHEPTTLAESTP